MDAAAATARAREADVTYLVKKLAGAEQQLRSNKAAALLRSGVALSPDRVQSLHAALLHKAAEAEHATSSRETAAAVVGDAIGSGETAVLQQLLPVLQSSCEGFEALHANICQVSVPFAHRIKAKVITASLCSGLLTWTARLAMRVQKLLLLLLL